MFMFMQNIQKKKKMLYALLKPSVHSIVREMKCYDCTPYLTLIILAKYRI